MPQEEEDLQRLEAAVMKGDLDEIEYITRKEMEDSKSMYNIFKKGVSCGQVEAAKLFVNRGCPIAITKPLKENEILHLAIATGDIELVQSLVKRKMTTNVVDKDGMPPLFKVVSLSSSKVDYSEFLNCLLPKKCSTINNKYQDRSFTVLHYAAEVGNADIIPLLLERNCHLNSKSSDGSTALHIAAKNRHSSAVKVLLDHGMKDSPLDNKKKSPLNLTIENGDFETFQIILNHIFKSSVSKKSFLRKETKGQLIYSVTCVENSKMVELLLVNGISPNYILKETRQSVLHLAVEKNSMEIVELLLEHKAALLTVDKNGFTPFHVACVKGNLEIITKLIETENRLLNAKSNEGLTAIHLAAKYGHARVVSFLLELGATCTELDKNNKTPVSYAIENTLGDKETLSILLKHIQETKNIENNQLLLPEENLLLKYYAQSRKNRSGNSPLHLAVQKEDETVVNLLLKHRACIDTLNVNGHSPLDLATINGSFSIVNLFLKDANDPKMLFISKRKDGFTPMHFAVQEENTDMLELFFKARIRANLHFGTKALVDADTETSDDYKPKGLTPLHVAVQKNNKNLIKLLLENGAKVDVPGRADFETPLFTAAENGYVEILEILSEVSTIRSEGWKEGYLPLCIAAYRGHEKVVEMLLKKGVDPNANIHHYLTPMHAAAQQGHENIIQLLLEHGAMINPNPKNDGDKSSFFSTPLLAAAYSNHSKIVQLFLKNGANFNAEVRASKKLTTKSEENTEKSLEFDAKSSGSLANSLQETSSIQPDSSSSKSVAISTQPATRSTLSATRSSQTVSSSSQPVSSSSRPAAKSSRPKAKPSKRLSMLSRPLQPVAKCLETISTIEKILKHGNYKSEEIENDGSLLGYRTLHFAVQAGDKEVVNSLIKSSADLNCQTRNGSTAVGISIEKEDVSMLNLLFAAGADILTKHKKMPIFKMEILKTNVEIAEMVIKFFASCKSNVHLSPLNIAVENELEACVEKLLKTHTDFKNKQLLLHTSVKKKNSTIVKLLLKHGADVNHHEEYQGTALMTAVDNNDPEIVDLLLEAGAKNISSSRPNEYMKSEPFKVAIQNKCVSIVDIFLKRGFINSENDSPFRLALRDSSVEIVQMFLSYGASTDINDTKGELPIFYAIKGGNLKMVQFLLKTGTSINATTISGDTILLYAMKIHNLSRKMFQTIVDHGVDVNAIGVDNRSPLNLILSQKCPYSYWQSDRKGMLINILLSNGANPNQLDMSTGLTMIDLAVDAKSIEYLKLLILHGADINLMNMKNETSLSLSIHLALKRSARYVERFGLFYNHHISNELDNLEYDTYWIDRSKLSAKYYRILPFRETVRLLVQEIARRQAADEEVNEEDAVLVHTSFLKNYYERCKNEINLMKATAICEGISFFHILVAKTNNLSNFARIRQVKHVLLTERKIHKLFPEYGELLIGRIMIGKDRKYLMESSYQGLKLIFRNKCPPLVANHIFSFLSCIDLKNLHIAKEMKSN